jgi:WD40 repeat protein
MYFVTTLIVIYFIKHHHHRFHPQDPHLLFGGCYNGQILLWDMRMKSLPVQRSSMSGRGHRHPVYAMSMSGIGATMECVTVSTGKTLHYLLSLSFFLVCNHTSLYHYHYHQFHCRILLVYVFIIYVYVHLVLKY